MKKLIALVALLGLGAILWTALVPADPVSAARTKCEAAIERSTGHDISIMDVSRATVEGDVSNGTVRLPFSVGGAPRKGECVFQNGATRRVTVDGRLLTGKR